MTTELSQIDQDRMRWMQAYLALPQGGVRNAFPRVRSCAVQFATVRWPDGVSCIRCRSSDVGYLALRKLYACRSCRRQFSVTAGTCAHHSRLSLRQWFTAAEDIITAHAFGEEEGKLAGHRLAKKYRISYAAAYRLKKILLLDLQDPNSLFLPSVCVRDLVMPQDVESAPHERFRWLVSETLAARSAGTL